MDEQKYCIKHRLNDGSYFAVLSGGWRYDGSMIVEAATLSELEYKLNEVRYDDRWVTMEGNHVLIGSNGFVKAGAGGRLTGRKFGMRFRDYDHGHINKKGKRMIRQYTIVGKKNGEKRIVGGEFTQKGYFELKKQYIEARISASKNAKQFFGAMSKMNKAREKGLTSPISDIEYEKLRTNSFNAKKKSLKLKEELDNYKKKAVAKGVKLPSDSYERVENELEAVRVKRVPVKKLQKALTDAEIIARVGGPDQTGGSCVSVALTYIANKQGLDVLDFRGGESRKSLARSSWELHGFDGIRGKNVKVTKEIAGALDILRTMEREKEYFFVAGRHASIVRKTSTGAMEYLELQGSSQRNGWHSLTGTVLKDRFKASYNQRTAYGAKLESKVILLDVDSFKNSKEFIELASYFNTQENKQKKGAGGYAK